MKTILTVISISGSLLSILILSIYALRTKLNVAPVKVVDSRLDINSKNGKKIASLGIKYEILGRAYTKYAILSVCEKDAVSIEEQVNRLLQPYIEGKIKYYYVPLLSRLGIMHVPGSKHYAEIAFYILVLLVFSILLVISMFLMK